MRSPSLDATPHATPDATPHATQDAAAPLRVGNRVEHKQARGFVRYVGELRGQSGLWVGVDWDDVSRGRHDGTMDSVAYFVATGPKSGSFVRASKLAHGGRRTLADAIRIRLSAEHDIADTQNTTMLGNTTVSFHFNTAPELTAGSLRTIPSIDVSRLGVAGPIVLRDADVGVDLTSVKSLRVAEALLADFDDVHALVDTFPQLTDLDVARNRFDGFGGARNNAPAAVNLQRLDLNGCNIRLGCVWELCARCPALTELRLFNTGLQSLKADDDKYRVTDILAHVRLIDLGGNKVPWRDVLDVLGMLPELEDLFIGDNDIGLADECVDIDGAFPALRRLSLSGNPLSSFSLLTSLVRVPSLLWLLVANTPITSDEARRDDPPADDAISSRHAIMGRLGQLTKLHGALIDADERMYAEKRYLRVECLPALASCASRDEAERAHPRMRELCEKYGVELDTCAKEAVMRTHTGHADTLRRDLVTVTFQRDTQDATISPCHKKLPRSVHAAKLRALARRFLALPHRAPVAMRMFHKGVDIGSDSGNRTLAQLHVKPGDEVLVKVE